MRWESEVCLRLACSVRPRGKRAASTRAIMSENEKMRVLFLVLDGLADISHPQLGWRTPLQAASTATMDRLAQEGCCALMYPLPPGTCPSSEVAHWIMFGYRLEDFPGRTYLHALSEGIPCEPGDALFMFNLVPVVREKGFVFVRDDSGVDAEEVCARWAERLCGMAPPGMELHYLGGIEFIARVKSGSHRVLATDPFLHHLPVGRLEAVPGWEEDGETRRTVEVLTDFVKSVEAALAGEDPGIGEMGLIMKWPSRVREAVSFADKYGMRAAAAVSTPCFRGMAELLGMRVYLVGEREADADLAAKLAAAESWWEEGGDFVFLHTKHPDEAAHTGDPNLKVKVIEALDRALESFWHLLEDEGTLTVITADHSTPSVRDRRVIHGGDPVPVLFHGRTVRRDSLQAFDEVSAAGGGMGQLRGEDLMRLVLYFSRRAPFFTGL